MKKQWCVAVFENPHLSIVTAATAEEAEASAMQSMFAGSYSDISHVVVKRSCEKCGFHNAKDANECRFCGNSL
jgi:hypothetical protein